MAHKIPAMVERESSFATTTMSSSSSSVTPRIKIVLPRSLNDKNDDDDDDEEQEFDGDNTTDMSVVAPYSAGCEPMTPQKPMTTSSLWDGLRNKNLNFPINSECTSLCLSPSGNFVWAGFSDGTLRVFDLAGRFDLGQETWESSRQKSSLLVPSTSHQRFGAVACQIHARGVHTDLLMQVDTCGEYVFGGVPRGAIEVYAVHIKDLEAKATGSTGRTEPPTKNILDYIHVHVHADAKLKGLGACTQLQTASRPTYLLLTGKGIKNIHIWKFQPPLVPSEDAIWEQLYDTQTNGNTINFLSFYRNPEGKLLGVSQSDTQKVRLWDLSVEEQENPEGNRPKRPDYEDVTNSQAALGIAGGYGVCGGPTMYNQFSIVSLDYPTSVYNHTELALPGEASWGRQRRGDLKQVVNVATLPNDSNHALLELDDGSIVHYTSNKSGRPKLETLTEENTGIRNLPADYWCRTICLGNPGLIVAALSYYNPNTQTGHIVVRSLQPVPLSSSPAVDNKALSRLCMEAPPASALKTKKKKKKRHQERNDGVVTAMEPQVCSTTMVAIPLSMDVSVKKLKKKKKKMSTSPSSSASSMPVSVKKIPSSATSVPVSAEKASVEHYVPSTSLDTPSHSVSLFFETKQPSPSAMIAPPPQVSPPSMITPAAAPKAGAPSSEESSKADYGAIAKFMKPKRVLHNYSEQQPIKALPSVPRKIHKDQLAVSLKTCVSDKSIPSLGKKGDTESVSNKSLPSLDKKNDTESVSNESLPSLDKKDDTESVSNKSLPSLDNKGDTEFVSNKSRPYLGKKGDTESVEIKILRSLEIQPATPVAKRKSEHVPETEPKRQCPTAPTVESSLENVAHLLVDLKSPVPKAKGPSPDFDFGVGVNGIGLGLKDLLPKLVHYRESLPKPKSRLLTRTTDAFGCFPSQSPLERTLTEHRAAQERIQKQLLHAAESSLRLLSFNRMTPEGTRSELKDIIRSFEEVLHDTLTRQELELEALVEVVGKSPSLTMAYRGAFDLVMEIYNTIEPGKRTPGRPKAM